MARLLNTKEIKKTKGGLKASLFKNKHYDKITKVQTELNNTR